MDLHPDLHTDLHNTLDLRERYHGALLGLAVGDAVGTSVEFSPRGTFAPVTDMTGGGPFHLAPGQWTDDTSMALCLAASLVEQGDFDARDQMDRYCAWMQHGYMSSTGTCFDIGVTTSRALQNYLKTNDPFSGSEDPRASGNGSLMRLAPVPMFYYPDITEAIHYSGESSRTTHAAPECVDGCRYFALLLCQAFAGQEKEALLAPPDPELFSPPLAPKIAAIARGDYRAKTRDRIVGNGYVVNSLEAAIWSFATTATYQEAILTAVNLGDDADTTAAICGQIAGAYYGVSGIPPAWLAKLALRSEIEALADRLLPAPV
ncbi:MAG: ADP-ribosylglycohydrolase family protein [Caldilineaceae bacterium]|nr:ADP-ribosylglycohydrolase family protein [Caldilineaceae bacterium]